MTVVEQLAWNFDPRHFPEGYGYAVLRPVKRMG